MFVGNEEHTKLKQRTIYQVVEKKLQPQSTFSHHEYRYRVAFDFENPVGQTSELISHWGTRGLKKLSLVDVGFMRLAFDNFIREWARSQGADDTDDVR